MNDVQIAREIVKVANMMVSYKPVITPEELSEAKVELLNSLQGMDILEKAAQEIRWYTKGKINFDKILINEDGLSLTMNDGTLFVTKNRGVFLFVVNRGCSFWKMFRPKDRILGNVKVIAEKLMEATNRGSDFAEGTRPEELPKYMGKGYWRKDGGTGRGFYDPLFSNGAKKV